MGHSRAPSADFGGPHAAAARRSSFAEAAGSPRVTPRHSRNSSIEALASAAAFVQPYKARILYGGSGLLQHQNLLSYSSIELSLIVLGMASKDAEMHSTSA